MAKQYETVIGLEVHVELATKTKIFCGCSTEFGGAPNTHTCPVCTGMPGSLPILNRQVVEYTMAVGLALNCKIHQYSKFDRKNYFYPDNPQNYQISQLYLPICYDGFVEIETTAGAKRIGIHEIHMEEDAGKLVHDEWNDCSLVDYNRSGVPLIEIVSEPDMRSTDEVISYLEKLRTTIQYLGASDCKLNEGSMRADVNLSVREAGAAALGTRTEMKNLNSFKEYSYPMRSKEDAQDYRYFPDPDLTPIVISDEWIRQIKDKEPEFQEAKADRYAKEYDIPSYDISIITASKKMADIFEQTVSLGATPKKVSNWLMGETLRLLKERQMDTDDITLLPENLAKLIDLTDKGTINSTVAKEIFEKIFEENIDVEKFVEDNGLGTVSDESVLRETIEKVVEENPQSVADYQAGKKKAIGFLVGQTMRVMKGKADPELVNKILQERLE